MYDASRDWGVSKQTMEVVDNRVETEVALNRSLSVGGRCRTGFLRGCEILESAFEQRDDRLCVVRQLAELLRLPFSMRKGVTGQQIHKFCEWRRPCAAGRCWTAASPPRASTAPWPAVYRDHAFAFFCRNARAVVFCDGEPRDQPRYRGERRDSTTPLFRDWKEW